MTNEHTRELKLATYNVQGRLWTGRSRRVDGIRTVLDEVDADLWALQEVHDAPESSRTYVNGQGTEFVVEYGPNLTKARGPFGNAFLSRYPISDLRRIDLSESRREPRGALDVSLEVEGRRVRVVATHLGLRAGERQSQVARLLDEIEPLDAELFVLTGDFNEWRPGSPALRLIEERLGPAPRVSSFPSRLPIFSLDRVWTRPSEALLDLSAHRSPGAARASDHLPVVATVALSTVPRPEPE